MIKTNVEKNKLVVAFEPTIFSGAATTAGAIIDTLGFESLSIYTAVGAFVAGILTVDSIKESNAAAMTGATAIASTGTFTAQVADGIGGSWVLPTKRYVQITLDGDATADFNAAAVAVLSNASKEPTV